MFRSTLLLAAVAAFALAGAGLAARAQDAPKGDIANGKRVYLKLGCFTCHGRVGQGGGYNQPTPSLAKTQMPFEGFVGQLRAPSHDMPAYSASVTSDQEIADMYAFVQSLPGRTDPKAIAILNN